MLSSLKLPPEQGKGVLPLCLQTTMTFYINFAKSVLWETKLVAGMGQ